MVRREASVDLTCNDPHFSKIECKHITESAVPGEATLLPLEARVRRCDSLCGSECLNPS